MKKTPKILPTYYKSPGTPIFRDTTALPFALGGPIEDEPGTPPSWNRPQLSEERIAALKAFHGDSIFASANPNDLLFYDLNKEAIDNATDFSAFLDPSASVSKSFKEAPTTKDIKIRLGKGWALDTKTGAYFKVPEELYKEIVTPKEEPMETIKTLDPALIDRKPLGSLVVPEFPAFPTYQMPGYMKSYNFPTVGRYTPLAAKAVQKATGYDRNFMEGYYDEKGNFIPGELQNAQEQNRAPQFVGASSFKDMLAQREYLKTLQQTRGYAQGGRLAFEPSEYGSDPREHYADGGPIYTYSKRPGSYYQRTPEGWAISNASTGNQYVPINDPTGERAALLNKYATVYNAPVQGAPKPVMNQAVWNKAQQQGEQDLAAKQFVANVHKQSGTSGLYMPDGSLKPQAAQAANWVPQAIIGAPIAAEVLGAAASIPLGAGVNLGGVVNAAGLVHGATQIDNRYQDWQDVAAGNMDWKEAALKTGLTGLDFAGAGIPIKNANNIIKSMNAPTFTKGKTLVSAPAAKKVLGTIDEYGDFTDASGVTVYGASSPIGGNPVKLNKQLLDSEAPAISLKDWKEAQEKAIATNERFIIPKAEEQFLVNKYADEFSKQFNIPTYQLNPKDVGLYGKLKELEFIPTRETVRNAESEYMPALSREIHSDFLQTHKPTLDLTKKEELVLDAYARGYDQLINTREAEKVAPFYQEKIAPILEQSILKNKFQQPQSLIRGTKNFDINNEGFVIRNGETLQDLKFSDLKEGDLFVPKSFTSTSVIKAKPETTLGFEAPLTGFTQRAENLDYVINAPAGQSYMYPNASNIQHFPQEMEVILPKDLQFKLDRVASDVERGYLGNVDDIQKGVLYKGFTKMPNKYFPSISRFDKIVDLKGNKIPKKNISNMINYHNRMHQPSIPKYYFSIANPYLFGGRLNKNC